MMKSPSCNSYMSFKMDYSGGNPIVVYTCENCKYTTFGESYITDNKTTMTIGCDMATSSTKLTKDIEMNNSATIFTIK